MKSALTHHCNGIQHIHCSAPESARSRVALSESSLSASAQDAFLSLSHGILDTSAYLPEDGKPDVTEIGLTAW